MNETPYATEELLQRLVANYPDLIPGDKINPENPRRWLLVDRELGIPGKQGGASLWSLDHLLLDQDGIPTFVECKRAADIRSRREVVAQMLDYAANGTKYWDIDHIKSVADGNAQRNGKNIEREIRSVVNPAAEPDDSCVQEFLAAGRGEPSLRQSSFGLRSGGHCCRAATPY
jgi:hypothetical protein